MAQTAIVQPARMRAAAASHRARRTAAASTTAPPSTNVNGRAPFFSDGAGFDHLTVDDHAPGQAGLPDPLEHDLAAADRHLGRAYRGGADVESDDLSGHVAVSLLCLSRALAPVTTGGGRESDRPAQVRP